MTSLIRASLSSTKLFMIRVKGQMKTKTWMMLEGCCFRGHTREMLLVGGIMMGNHYPFRWELFFVLAAKELS